MSVERANWNMEDEVESAARPPSGQEASLRGDSSSETSSYSESSRTTTVTGTLSLRPLVRTLPVPLTVLDPPSGFLGGRRPPGDSGLPEPSGPEEGVGESARERG